MELWQKQLLNYYINNKNALKVTIASFENFRLKRDSKRIKQIARGAYLRSWQTMRYSDWMIW
jgi:hypothetical protein